MESMSQGVATRLAPDPAWTARLGKVDPSSAYERYLCTDELLGLQKDPGHLVESDEMAFMIVHQPSELWLELAAHELRAALSATRSGVAAGAVRHLRTVHSCLRPLTEQLDVVDPIPPWSFRVIRTQLEDGSGFSSPGWTRTRGLAPELGAEFTALGARRASRLEDSYTRDSACGDLYELAEGLVDLDADCMLWRTRHVKLVERMLGLDALGLAGTRVEVLTRLSTQRLCPDLWRARSGLTGEAVRSVTDLPRR